LEKDKFIECNNNSLPTILTACIMDIKRERIDT